MSVKIARYIIPLVCLVLTLPLRAQQDEASQMKHYAEAYARCENVDNRLRLANEFFTYLLGTGYIDAPIAFPTGSHIDSVDVNVYYYIAEWHYGEGDYQAAIDYLTRATQCMGVVDDVSKSDVYGLMGAVYFRMSAFEKAAEALNQCYELDKKAGDFDRMSSTLNGIASVFVAAGKPQEAEKYILEAIAANSLTDNLARRAVLFGTTSEIYRSLDNAEQSLEYARKALDTERQLGDSARIGVRLSQLASAQLGLSKVDEARRSLEEAIPLLHRSGNLHSWGICQNQMGDILASEDKNEEAAAYYLEAAMLFLGQGDKYNELHAREGLYRVTKSTSPDEAMLHLERAKLLQDSIYKHETGEALGKYNAIYYNDILQKEKERRDLRDRNVLIAAIASSVLLLALIALAILITYRRHRRKVKDYEQHISRMEDQYSQVSRQYQNLVADTMQESENLTGDDKLYLEQLTGIIYDAIESGVTDIDSIAKLMHTNAAALRRRLTQTINVTPKAYIQRMRMNKAKYLLQNYRDITIAEVADKCGYSQVTNFTRAFTRYYGIMPSDARTQKAGTNTTDTLSHDSITNQDI